MYEDLHLYRATETFMFLGYLTVLDTEVKILFAKVPDAKRFNKDINLMPSAVNSIDWGWEPILVSGHDA